MKKLFKCVVALVLLSAVGVTLAAVFSSDRDDNAYLKRELHLVNEAIVIGEGGSGTNGFGGQKIWDFDEGRIKIHGILYSIKVGIATNLVEDGSGLNFALGSATAIPTTGATAHTGVRVDLGDNVEVDPWTNGVTKFEGALTGSPTFDGTAIALDMFANVLVDDADISQASVTGRVDGVIQILYSIIGDF